MPRIDPIRPTDDTARDLARALIGEATFGALGTLDHDTGHPSVTRIAVARTGTGEITTLISDLSAHTKALRANPHASLLLGEPGDKGDPLTFPRISLQVAAVFVDRTSQDGQRLRAHWSEHRPKSRLYIDFADFNFVRFDVRSAALNGGFGKAFVLTAEDLMTPPSSGSA